MDFDFNRGKEDYQWEYYDDFETYKKENDDLWQYVTIHSRESGLDVDIMFDDSASYEMFGHPKWCYFQNGINSNDYLPLTISKNPKIPLKLGTYHLALSRIQLKRIIEYIRLNLKEINIVATGKTSTWVFCKKLKKLQLNEEFLFESPKLSQDKTGLPMMIWLDGTSRFTNHAPRIKFNATKNPKLHSTEYSSITISDEPEFFDLPPKKDLSLSLKDLESLKKWVQINKKDLLSILNQEIDFKNFTPKQINS